MTTTPRTIQTRHLPIAKSKPLALAIAAVLSVSAAQVVADDDDDDDNLEEVTVIGQDSTYKADRSSSHKYSQSLLDTAKTLTVIPESVLQDRNADSLREGLRGIAGITLAAGEGGAPPGDSLYIRGFSARNDIMIDGVRDIAGYSRDTYNVEAVEVAKGPGSAVHGRGATGGSINLQLKTAKLEDFSSLGLRGGSESDYRVTTDLNRTLGNSTAIRLNLLTDDGEVAGRDEIENSKNALAVTLATGIGTGTRLSLSADYQEQDNIPDYGLPWVPNYSGRTDRTLGPELAPFEGQAPTVDFSNFYGNLQRDFEDVTATSVTATVEHDISASTTLRALVRGASLERESIVTAPRFEFVESADEVRTYGPGVVLSDEKTRDTEDSLAVLQLDLIGHYETGRIEHDIVTGIEVAREEFKRYQLVDIVDDNLDSTPAVNDLQNPNPNIAFTGQYARDGSRQKAEGDTLAAYLFDTITLNEQWQVSAGLRWDRFETDYQHDYDDPTLRLSAVDEEISWSAALVFKPADNGSIYFGAGSSFSPSAEDLTASTRGNRADLDPEESLSFELGTKWELFDSKLFATAALFRTEKTNARTDDPFADNDRDDTLNGEQRVDGLELGAVGQISEQLSITAAYTYQDGEVTKAEGDDAVQVGTELARTPKHSYSVWGRYDFNERLSLALGTLYIGKRYNSADPGGREKAEDYQTVDLMASYQFNDFFGLQFNGSNLTDETYADQIGGGHFLPGEGRYYTVSANFSF